LVLFDQDENSTPEKKSNQSLSVNEGTNTSHFTTPVVTSIEEPIKPLNFEKNEDQNTETTENEKNDKKK